MVEKLIFDKNSEVTKNNYVPNPGTEDIDLGAVIDHHLLRGDLDLPNLGELEVIRHYCRLAEKNFSVDTNFYPLGSCTMKYNPKINEDVANLSGFINIHPYQNERSVQGALELIYNLEKLLCEITGMKRFSLAGSSGAQGELSGMLMIRQYHKHKGNKKTKVIVPDSAHGTNPATATMCGYKIVVVPSNKDGLVDIEKLKEVVDSQTAAIMLTNPNTLGLFEEQILEIADIIHDVDGLMYYDGANFNPLLGITKPSLMGFDVLHLNLHKTFATPHGCGGPGAGAVGVCDKLINFLPIPIVKKNQGTFCFNYEPGDSIGRIRTFYGNFTVLVRAYAYILRLGKEGLKRVAQMAVINANYIKERLKEFYDVPYPNSCMHEVVLSAVKQKEKGASALDIAKRLIDYGIHPPTMYFPLIVKEALMVEPTETESKATLDNFINIMIKIDKEINVDPDTLKNSPRKTPVLRVDEVRAARFPDLRWQKTGD